METHLIINKVSMLARQRVKEPFTDTRYGLQKQMTHRTIEILYCLGTLEKTEYGFHLKRNPICLS